MKNLLHIHNCCVCFLEAIFYFKRTKEKNVTVHAVKHKWYFRSTISNRTITCVGFGLIFHLNFIGFSAWEELFCQITHPACNPQVESVLLHVVMSATLQKGGINGQTFFFFTWHSCNIWSRLKKMKNGERRNLNFYNTLNSEIKNITYSLNLMKVSKKQRKRDELDKKTR